jgi:hypothetical protein
MGIRPVGDDTPHSDLTPKFSELSAVNGGGAVPQAGSTGTKQHQLRRSREAHPMCTREKGHAYKTKPTRWHGASVPISNDPSLTTKPSRKP